MRQADKQAHKQAARKAQHLSHDLLALRETETCTREGITERGEENSALQQQVAAEIGVESTQRRAEIGAAYVTRRIPHGGVKDEEWHRGSVAAGGGGGGGNGRIVANPQVPAEPHDIGHPRRLGGKC